MTAPKLLDVVTTTTRRRALEQTLAGHTHRSTAA